MASACRLPESCHQQQHFVQSVQNCPAHPEPHLLQPDQDAQLTGPQAQLHTAARTRSLVCLAQRGLQAAVPAEQWLQQRHAVLLVFCWLRLHQPDQLIAQLLLQLSQHLLGQLVAEVGYELH